MMNQQIDEARRKAESFLANMHSMNPGERQAEEQELVLLGLSLLANVLQNLNDIAQAANAYSSKP